MRSGASDQAIIYAIQEAISHKAKDGFEAEKSHRNNLPVHESMTTIGG